MTSKTNVHIFERVQQLNESAAELIVKLSKKAISERNRFCISLSGGETPRKLYAILASEKFRERIDWQNTHVFWGDERCLPLEDERNNAHESRLILLDKINIPSENIHIIPVNLSPAEAAATYENEIASFFGNQPIQLDLMLLGLGANGHTASLFPHTDVLNESTPGVKAIYLKDQNMFRITMTAPLINNSRVILFLVTGKEKAETVKSVLEGAYLPEHYPAQLITNKTAELNWFMDKDAASLLKPENL
ncbi:MAG: 6-phosphogluconolactonase [Bacteroidia bacterium]